MSSSLIVPITQIEKLTPHPNADKLEVAVIGGWQVVVGKDSFAEGDLVVYFPPDTNLPTEVSDKLGVTNYLSVKTNDGGLTFKGRVRAIKLRGEPSFGFAVPLREVSPEFVTEEQLQAALTPNYVSLSQALLNGEVINVAESFGAEKYEPPIRATAGDAERADGAFVRYTDIENLRNYTKVIREDEEVVITEKIHGANCRLGFLRDEDGTVRAVAGSNKLQRRRPETEAEMKANQFWFGYTIPSVQELMNRLSDDPENKQVTLFGEVYGSQVQNLRYDAEVGELKFRAFDLQINGKYVDFKQFLMLMTEYGIPYVPVLAIGTYSLGLVKELANTNSLLNPDQIKEGVVVKPTTERVEPRGGRVIFKFLSDEYLTSKGITDATDV